MRDAMSLALHIRQAARGSRALQAMRSGGRDAFTAVMAEPLEELAAVYRDVPIYYITNRFTVVGPGVEVNWPRYSQVMDYELEIGIVTRRTRANIPTREAGADIFGYTIFNDFSARDRQAIEMQGRLGPAKGKSFDGGNVVGPWIVTQDELGDAERRGPGQWRDASQGRHPRDAVLLRGASGLRFAGRDDPRRGILRLGDCRQLLRTGDRPVSRGRRRGRSSRGPNWRPDQQGLPPRRDLRRLIEPGCARSDADRFYR